MRVNQTKLNIKRDSGYMIDSTYLNACDPNSMRDQGPCRNAQYVMRIHTNNEPNQGKPEY